MARVGDDKPELDPFRAGNKAFGALDEALGSLDQKPATNAPVPPEKGAEGKRQAPAQEAKPSANPTGRRPPNGKKKTKASGGGAKPSPVTEAGLTSSKKRARRFLATDEEMANWQRAAMRLGAATGARIDFSKITRALWEIYLRHEDDVVRNIPADGEWQRPSNADSVGLAELDEQLAELLNEGLMVASRRPRNIRRSGN